MRCRKEVETEARRGDLWAFLVWALALSLGGNALAQTPTVPDGEQFLVNTYTTSTQYGSRVAMNDGGAFVVVWTSTASSVDSDYGAFGQAYDSDGQPIGGEFHVNSFTPYNQYSGGVAMHEDGSFVVTWDGYTDDSTEAVAAQLFASNGTPVGDALMVSGGTHFYYGPDIGMARDGNFIVTWSGFPEGEDAFGVQARRYTSSGAPLDAPFAVNTTTADDQEAPSIAVDADGSFVITWTDGPFSISDIRARRFASDGAPAGDEFLVNTYTTGRQAGSAVGMAQTGEFVVVWTGDDASNGDSSGTSVQGQRFDSGGNAVSAPFLVNSYTSGLQTSPRIAFDPDGSFIVAWSSTQDPVDTSQSSNHVQRFHSDGQKIGPQLRVNNYTLGAQISPGVAVSESGDFVVVWDSSSADNGDNASFSVQAQRFRVTADIGDFVFEDRNADGLQNEGELGIPGLTVHLFLERGELLASTVTDASGKYAFQPKIALQGVADRFFLQFEAPEGFVFSQRDIGADDTVDSDVDPQTGQTPVFEILSAGVSRLDQDAGMYVSLFRDGFEAGDTAAWSSDAP